MKKIIHVVGARPNFMKMAPVYKALSKKNFLQKIVHTGQHYSDNMSGIFFRELKIKKPDTNLDVGSGTHANQVASIMVEFEKYVLSEKPDLVIVYGDINSTVAATLVCAKLGIKTAHVEAGLRSKDMSMPEEINRLVTDRLSDIFFTPSIDGNLNLLKEGTDKKKIHMVGNVMIDTLVSCLDKIKQTKIKSPFNKYAIVTLHRPSNVDNLSVLIKIMSSLDEISKEIPLIFPIHPRTKKQLEKITDFKTDPDRIHLIEPLGYLDFLSFVYNSKLVITDSGGIQEETTYLNIPCLTLRENTERPITIDIGSNTLIGNDLKLLKAKVKEVINGKYKKAKRPKNWDGKASERIANVLNRAL